MKKIRILALAVCRMIFGAMASTVSGQTSLAQSTPFVKVGPTELIAGSQW